MKKHFSENWAFFLFILTVMIATCSSSCTLESGKKIKKEEIPKREELEKIPITLNLLEEWVSPSLLKISQVISGEDSVKLTPLKNLITRPGAGGKIIFVEVSPYFVLPSTFGEIIPNGIIFDEKTKKVKQLNVTFWGDNNLFLPFGPESDDLGTFSLLTLVAGQEFGNDIVPEEGLWVELGNNLYQVVSGARLIPCVLPGWEKGTPIIAPGRKVGEQNLEKNTPIKSPPYKKNEKP